MLPIISTFVGTIIGMFATFYGGRMAYLREKRSQERFSSAILYNDLKSIERYLAHERSSVNLRYSDDWQHMVAKCSYLREDEVEIIYRIYDEAYNYNYRYKLKEQEGSVNKEDIYSYEKMKKEMFDKSDGYINLEKHTEHYENILVNLQKHIKR